MSQRLIILLIFFFGAHIFIYYSAVRFFTVRDKRLKGALIAALAFLASGLIASRLLVRLSLNLFTWVFYALSAFWAGLAVNLLMALILCWLIEPALRAAGKRALARGAAAALCALAFLFSVYGAWNAFHPRIKRIEVAIAGLPDAWRDKTAVHISDVHLGALITPGYFRSVAGTINSLNPDLIFITGDLFDGISADGLSPFTGPLGGLRAKDGIFYVTGNHENYIGIGAVMDALSKTDIRALRDEVAVVDGVRIIGVDYPEYGRAGDVKKIIRSRKEFMEGAPAILLYHTPTSIERTGATPAEYQRNTYWNPRVDFTAARELGVGLQLSGHTHKGQMLPFVYLAGYLYGGYDYGLHSDGDFSIYITSGLGTVGPPMRTGTAPEIVVIRFKPLPQAARQAVENVKKNR